MTTRPPIRRWRQDAAERPFIVIWEVTRACALACRHCRADAVTDRHPFELTGEEGRRMLDDLADLGPPRPLVVLTGGDPFERDDLVGLVAHGAGRGLAMALSPSVTRRLTPDALTALHRAGARAVSISIDGARPETHDGFRGIDGVFDATLAATRDVRAAGLRLQCNTTVTRDNVQQLPEILGIVSEARAALWSVFFLVPTGRGSRLGALDAAETEDVLHWLADVSRHVAIKTTEAPHFRRLVLQRADTALGPPARGALYEDLTERTRQALGEHGDVRPVARPPLDVNAGRGFVFVDHLGAVYPSGFLPQPVGSVRTRPLTDIYRDSPLLRSLRDPDVLGGRCGRCTFRTVCGGSRSRAFATTGDPLAEDPSCVYDPGPDTATVLGGVSGRATSPGSTKLPSSSS